MGKIDGEHSGCDVMDDWKWIRDFYFRAGKNRSK
jgi:hypothetical protein